MIRVLNMFMFVANVAFVALLGFCYLSPSLNPEYFWPVALLGLSYPVLLVGNILFIVYWAFQLKLKFLYSLIAIAGGFSHISEVVQFNGRPAEPGGRQLRIATFNTQLQGYYEKKSFADTIGGFIKQNKYDVVCLQEFINVEKVLTSTLEKLKRQSGLEYMYFQVLDDKRKKGEYGSIILSRYPIVRSGKLEFENSGNLCIYADIAAGSDTFRVYNTHLQSFRFKKDDYNLLGDMPTDGDKAMKQSKGLLRRMREAYIKRAEQVQEMREHIDNYERGNMIICGDFNDPPMSYTYGQLSTGMKDAFIESGSGIGNTYIGKMPSFRIDYILHSPYFRAFDYQDHILTSDHRLVETTLKLGGSGN
ncbi:MAG: endonuclease/exonuclease/phosphatase family protein [Bacteroidia bacterium]|nr:endonuclease/exonuclease/phosphatase family protein [Bacteroidia bacterium]